MEHRDARCRSSPPCSTTTHPRRHRLARRGRLGTRPAGLDGRTITYNDPQEAGDEVSRGRNTELLIADRAVADSASQGTAHAVPAAAEQANFPQQRVLSAAGARRDCWSQLTLDAV